MKGNVGFHRPSPFFIEPLKDLKCVLRDLNILLEAELICMFAKESVEEARAIGRVHFTTATLIFSDSGYTVELPIIPPPQ
jgi:hypothetical protein